MISNDAIPEAAGQELCNPVRSQVQDLEKRRAETVEELTRCKHDLKQFVYVVSHDLQEPLRMVTAYAQLLGERYLGKLDEDADTYIGYAAEGALRMKGMMQGLLAFSRLGRNGLDRTRVDCNTVVEEAVRRLRPTVETSGAVITCGTLPSISADRDALLQLFQNLIGNAIKFRGEQAPVIEVRGEEVGAMSEFAVTDNGIGIAMEQIEIIFVIFQRLHPRG